MASDSSPVVLPYDRRDAKRLLIALLALELALVALYALMHIALPDASWGPFAGAFDLDAELSIPAWFSSVQLFLAGSTLLIVSRFDRSHRWFLVVGSLVLIFLSADEGAGLHERITVVARGGEISVLEALMIRNHGAWIVPYLLAGLALFILTIKPAIRIFQKHRRPSIWVIIGALTVVTGAVGLEIASYFLERGGEVETYLVEVAAEEFLEMLGVTLVFYGILIFGIELQSE